MYSNGPVSIRFDFDCQLPGSAMRSDTQLQTWPSYSGSGWVVSRNWTVSPSSSITSALAYSLNRSGQLSMSIIRSHTNSRGASMTTSLSVWAAILDHSPPSRPGAG